jgi:hypothetical protein
MYGLHIDPLLISRRVVHERRGYLRLLHASRRCGTKPNSRHIGMQQSVMLGGHQQWLQSFAGGGPVSAEFWQCRLTMFLCISILMTHPEGLIESLCKETIR